MSPQSRTLATSIRGVVMALGTVAAVTQAPIVLAQDNVTLTAAVSAGTCESLKDMPLENATVTSAEVVPEGGFQPPRFGPAGAGNQEPVPEHCKVNLHLTPTADSSIHSEVWLPLDDWNGRFLMTGNGGWGGAIQGYGDMVAALRRGYASAATDTGHSAAEDGPGGKFSLGHPEKIVDFAFRAIHDTVVKTKRIIVQAYQRPADYSYYKGCSTGGRQGIMSAQRYPGDFDGIIAGALANRHIHMQTAGLSRTIDTIRHPEKVIPEATANRINEAVMKKCDVLGEGFLNNPLQCSFDFSTLQCQAGQTGESCLTPAQLETVEEYYGGVKNSKGELIFSGQALGNPLGSRLGPPRSTGDAPPDSPPALMLDVVRMAYQDADYDWREFDLDKDMPLMDAAVGFVDAVDPDLRAFKAQGGKLILYAGWGDPGISPKNTVWYYENVLAEMGREQDDWARLFMVPGMGHCAGGDGPYRFETLQTLERWREKGEAPDEIMGANPRSGLSRPLCPYPQYAEYDGSGDLADSANWSCRAP